MTDQEENNNQADPIFLVGDKVAGFTIKEKIDEGGFGQVFRVTKNNNCYAMKIEYSNLEGGSAIKLETRVLTEIKARGVKHFPELFGAGRKPKYQYVVMQLLGDNLKVLRFKGSNPEQASTSTWTRIGIQCLYIIKLLHDIGFVHRDIKPANFAMGFSEDLPNSRLIYLFDFGLARPFIEKVVVKTIDIGVNTAADSEQEKPKPKKVESKKSTKVKADQKFPKKGDLEKAGEHERLAVAQRMKKKLPSEKIVTKKKKGGSNRQEINGEMYRYRPARPKTDFRGTQIYASPNAHLLKELGRADDVWSLLYMLADMVTPLPWNTDVESIGSQKDFYKLQTLFNDDDFSKIEDDLRSCDYYDPPDYDLVYNTLKNLMDRAKAKWRDPYDWELIDTPAYVAWKEKMKNTAFQWEDPKGFFKNDVWAELGQRFQGKIKKDSKPRRGKSKEEKTDKPSAEGKNVDKQAPRKKSKSFSNKRGSKTREKGKQEPTGKTNTEKVYKKEHG